MLARTAQGTERTEDTEVAYRRERTVRTWAVAFSGRQDRLHGQITGKDLVLYMLHKQERDILGTRYNFHDPG